MSLTAASAPARPMVKAGEVSRDAALGSIGISCRTPATPSVYMSAPRTAGKAYHFATYVNAILTHTGIATSSSSGVFTAVTTVINNRTSSVRLTINGLNAAYAWVTPRCAGTTSVSALTTVIGGVRGSAASYTLHNNSNGTVTRWNPCDGTIRVRVNPTGGGTGALADAQTAIKALAAVSGLHFVYDGTTTFIPRSVNSDSQPAPIVIAWGSRTQTDYLAAGAIGEGGWRTSGSSTDGVHWLWKIIQGFVVVDPSAHVAPGFSRGISRGSLLLHELGHVAGLGHTADALQVMSPVLTSASYGSWGSGDKAGLTALGATKGCVVAR